MLKNPEEAYLLGLVKSHLYTASFYYTYGGYQIATRLQEQQVTGDDKPFWQKVRQRSAIPEGSFIDCQDVRPDANACSTVTGRRPFLLEPPPARPLDQRHNRRRSARRE